MSQTQIRNRHPLPIPIFIQNNPDSNDQHIESHNMSSFEKCDSSYEKEIDKGTYSDYVDEEDGTEEEDSGEELPPLEEERCDFEEERHAFEGGQQDFEGGQQVFEGGQQDFGEANQGYAIFQLFQTALDRRKRGRYSRYSGLISFLKKNNLWELLQYPNLE